MAVFAPIISPDIFALRSDFRALSIHALNVTNAESTPETKAALVSACNSPCSAPWAEAHLEAWRTAFRAFGAKPQRTPCSAEALLKRASRDGVLPSVNAVVDLYNAVSLRFATPVGGENAETYVGAPHLVRANGDELFETMQSGEPSAETPEPEKLYGAMTLASPADAGAGARERARGLNPPLHRCGSSSKPSNPCQMPP